MLYERRYRYVSCFEEYENTYIVVSGTNNQVYFWDKESERIIKTIILEEEQSNGRNLFSQSMIWGDELILIPENAEHLVLYKFIKREICYFDVPENHFKLIKEENKIFLMGCKNGNLYQFDLLKRKMDLCDQIDNKMLTDEKLTPLSDLMFLNGISVKNKLVFPFRRHPQIYVFDIKKNEGYIKTVTDNTGFVDLIYEKGIYYLLSEDGIVHILDDEFNNIGMISLHIKKTKKIRYPYRYICINQKQIMLLPMYSRKIIKIDLERNEYQEINANNFFYGTGKYHIYKGKNENSKKGIIVLESENTNGCYIDIESEVIKPFLQIEEKENSINNFLQLNNFSIHEECAEVGKQIWNVIRDGIQ